MTAVRWKCPTCQAKMLENVCDCGYKIPDEMLGFITELETRTEPWPYDIRMPDSATNRPPDP